MTDDASLEESALLYVLGELPTEERAAFERRVDESVELHSLVGDLQSGTEALARAVPQQPLPSGLWSEIEGVIDAERKMVALPFRRKWAWAGWAAAACFVGWLLLGRGTDRSVKPAVAAAPEQGTQTVPASVAVFGPGVASSPTASSPTISPDPRESPVRATAQRPGALPSEPLQVRIAALEGRMAEISQTLTQRSVATAAGLGDVRFFQLPTAGQAAGAVSTALSPELQHALLLALARELARQQPGGDGMQGTRSLAGENGLGVDFVDLVPRARGQAATNAASELRPQSQLVRAGAPASDPAAIDRALLAGTGGVTGFFNGDRSVLIVDGSSVPGGYDHVTVTGLSAAGTTTAYGSFSLAGNPVVVSVPRGGVPGLGDSLVLTADSSFQPGFVPVVVGVFPAPGTNAP